MQIGNSGARMAAILSGTVDGTIMAADFVPKAKREGFNILTDLADTKIEYPFLSLNMMGPYIDRNLKLAKALIKSMSESIRALQTDPANAKDSDPRGIENRRRRDHRLRALRAAFKFSIAAPSRLPAGIQTVLDEIGKEAKGKNLKFDDYVDMRALRELEKEGFFKSAR